ncbi:hypothetical protein Scep_021882 [Stephania cephalantha]|uniref:Uncharacterized protein n=1 Tax=Stephania cephalantha TaxID=152367 RepID=A0AAP0FCP9_9MAGN
MKLLRASFHETMASVEGSSTISKVFVRNGGDPISWILSIGRAIDEDEEEEEEAEPMKTTSSSSSSTSFSCSSSLIVFICVLYMWSGFGIGESN